MGDVLTEDRHKRWDRWRAEAKGFGPESPHGRKVARINALLDDCAALEADLRSMHRRAQATEALAEMKLDKARDANSGGSFGRWAANLGYRMVKGQRDDARAAAERMRDLCHGLRMELAARSERAFYPVAQEFEWEKEGGAHG